MAAIKAKIPWRRRAALFSATRSRSFLFPIARGEQQQDAMGDRGGASDEQLGRAHDIPGEVPYLRAEPDRKSFWQRQLPHSQFNVGICWQGDIHSTADNGRSFSLRCLGRIAKIKGVRLISLQKNDGVEQLQFLPVGMNVEILGDELDLGQDAFLDTAAVMESLDLIITSDTAVAHLAGALGCPTWLALRHIPDWRWQLHAPRSAWYPTMRLFRQTVPGDWESVFAAMERELNELSATGPHDTRGKHERR